MPSSTWSASSDSPSSRLPSATETNAPLSYGRLPGAEAAPRNRNIVQMTLKIMNRTIQAPPRCEPEKRDRRPSFSGAFLSRICAKTPRLTSARTAIRSWAKPSTSQWPISGIAKSSEMSSTPYAST